MNIGKGDNMDLEEKIDNINDVDNRYNNMDDIIKRDEGNDDLDDIDRKVDDITDIDHNTRAINDDNMGGIDDLVNKEREDLEGKGSRSMSHATNIHMEEDIEKETHNNLGKAVEKMEILEKKEKKCGNKAKIVASFFCITTIALAGALAYTMTNINEQKDKLNKDLRYSKEEAKKANEIIAKYEDATKTKAEKIKEDNATIKEIIKPAVYDVKYQQLLNLMGKDKVVRGGQIFTNKTGNYLYASLSVTGLYKEKDNLGNEVEKITMGGANEEYYRELPNGDWKFAFSTQGPMPCSEFSATIRNIYHNVDHPDSKNNYTCMKNNNPSDTEHL